MKFSDENGTVCTDWQGLKEVFGVADQVPMTEAEELEPAGDHLQIRRFFPCFEQGGAGRRDTGNDDKVLIP